MTKIAGIDYGSKMAGTTVIALFDTSTKKLEMESSIKKKDADQFVLDFCSKHKPEIITLDAPLSLPGRLIHGAPYEDYFYRSCDRHFKAMSPMFLGGLTARAIKLSDQLKDLGIQVFESYPSAVADRLNIRGLDYKKSIDAIPRVRQAVQKQISFFTLPGNIPNWHHLDALLCLFTAFRILNEEVEQIGDPTEGLIYL